MNSRTLSAPSHLFVTLPVLGALLLAGCAGEARLDRASGTNTEIQPSTPDTAPQSKLPEEDTMQEESLATFGAGCFWCVEAVLEQMDGVLDVSSGYMGGSVENPTYKQVCSGTTGHAEVVQVRFDPARISYEELLDMFFQLHDPTTLNRQGADVGTQYRSVIFFHSPEQEEQARASIESHAKDFEAPIVTEVRAAATYYEAEDYHQDYYRANRSQPYCRSVIRPKLDKLGLDS